MYIYIYLHIQQYIHRDSDYITELTDLTWPRPQPSLSFISIDEALLIQQSVGQIA